MEPTPTDTRYVPQPYLDEDIFVVSFSSVNSYERSPEKAFIDLRSILQVSYLFTAHDYWSFSVLYRFQPNPYFFYLEHASKYKDKEPVPSAFAKGQHEDLLKAWMACRRKYAPKATLEVTGEQTPKEPT